MMKSSVPLRDGGALNRCTYRFLLQSRRQPCKTNISTKIIAFERSSKRRKGYPSETKVKKGHRVVHGEKELVEKLGRNDLCPCGSGRRFQALLSTHGQVRRQPQLLFSASRSTVDCEAKERRRKSIDFRFLFAYSAGR